MAVKVRRAEVADIPWLVGQGEALDKSVGCKRALWDTDYTPKVFAGLIDKEVVLIAYEGAERFGFIAGHIAPHPFNPQIKVLSQILWWVTVARRFTRAGILLLQEFETIGRASADWIVFSLGRSTSVRGVHLTKRGFREIERAYLLEV